MIPDLRKILITEYRVLVSKKRTRNMLDLASLWKKTVLEKLERRIVSEVDIPSTRTASQAVLDDFGFRGSGSEHAVAGPSGSRRDDTPDRPVNYDGAEVRFTDVYGNYVVNLGRRGESPDSDEEMGNVPRRRSPPPPNAWLGYTR